MVHSEKDFILRTPFNPEQQAQAIQRCVDSIDRDFQLIEIHGWDEFEKQSSRRTIFATRHGISERKRTENLGTPFEGSVREYQNFMFECSIKENIIAHLGTGMGKTLISLLLIKKFLSNENIPFAVNAEKKNQILFLVLSVALALQHTDTLRANLTCRVETACHSSPYSASAREDIADADVVVATHGAAMDLLRHYPDIMSMSQISLLVIDECHYATGYHNYAAILRNYYHCLPKDQRPRVLGLTASPLINVSHHTDEDELQTLLSNFESIMDAKLIGFPTEIDDRSNIKEASESVVEYLNQKSIQLPSYAHWRLHKTRVKELNQLQYLCETVGVRVTATYASTLSREVSINEFERERQTQFQNFKSYLFYLVNYLEELLVHCKGTSHDGHSNKMRKLEALLTSMLTSDNTSSEDSPVGIVFVERRITAIALSNYFCVNTKGNLPTNTDVGTILTENGDLSSHPHNKRNLSLTLNDAEKHCRMNIVVVEERHELTAGGKFNYICDDENSKPFVKAPCISTEKHEKIMPSAIRCDYLVRKSTNIFKYLSGNSNELRRQQLKEDWVHQTQQIRTVIKKLRHRQTNVLFATSIVEEGIDVDACSFIVAFDGIKTIKSYIQMKGRARQKEAKFFVFDDVSINSQPLTLSTAQAVESKIHRFIVDRDKNYARDMIFHYDHHMKCSLETDEDEAMKNAQYKTEWSMIDLSSSKSILNRYSQSVPLDSSYRTSKEAIRLHMPLYEENKLILPTHIPPDIRQIYLPCQFHNETKKTKQSLMALAACVRLHKLGLLNDRLLPLSEVDMKNGLIQQALVELPKCKTLPSLELKPPSKVYVFKICQTGSIFLDQEHLLSHLRAEMTLAFISQCPLPSDLPPFIFNHSELGCIDCILNPCGSIELSQTEWMELTNFHSILFNARWRRKSTSQWFRFEESLFTDYYRPFIPYLVGILDGNDVLNWSRINTIIHEFRRSSNARLDTVQSYADSLPSPRVCNPTYSPNSSYIIFEASGKICKDKFPTDKFGTYEDYYAERYSLNVNPNGKLLRARRLWEFPLSDSHSDLKPNLKSVQFVDIPQEHCAEAMIADPLLILHSIMLPQILFRLERYLTAAAFIQHCFSNFPTLGLFLSRLPLDSVVEALTAKSCLCQPTYDRLEWLGDAVLKLLHTDALLKWKKTFYLHEGYLSLIRSGKINEDFLFYHFAQISLKNLPHQIEAMGTNERLKECAQQTGIMRYIMTVPLTRSDWRPCGLYSVKLDDFEQCELWKVLKPSDKVCADAVEAIIGLIYLNNGIVGAKKVACELGISFDFGDAYDAHHSDEIAVDHQHIKFASSFLGIQYFNSPNLLVEATTHQSCLHKPVPSYQRLEWIGDAVLCLAARDWLFRYFDSLTVSKLVVFETTLTCNESLAYIGFSMGLNQFIDHRDSSLVRRFESFQYELESKERGLWGTDPPKVISDVVEALIGVVHIGNGFEEGQIAALNVINPIIQSIQSLTLTSDRVLTDLKGILHPKQHLYEMTGGHVRVRAYKREKGQTFESSFFSLNDDSSCDYIGIVDSKGIIIAMVLEASKQTAINISCSLAIEVLVAKPTILSKLRGFFELNTLQTNKVVRL